MQKNKHEFIALAIEHEVLCFGEYTLKSGRVSPYFFNAGRFQTGAAMASLGRLYAYALAAARDRTNLDIDMLFGPAYKGIPLTTAAAVALSNEYGLDYPVCYNRKEAKAHGEGGRLIGAPLLGRVAIIDDVITAGTAIREVMEIIQTAGAQLGAVVVGLDRQERGQGQLSAIQEIEKEYGVPVISLIKLDDVIQYMVEYGDRQIVDAMVKYRGDYGV